MNRERRLDLGIGSFLLLVMILLVAWTWRKWPDVLVDYGLQLYAPWQLASGKVLYRDVAYVSGGPLSQYFHALIFKLFGVSFIHLVVINLVLLAVMLGFIYRLFLRAADRWTAAMICLVILCGFSFAQYLDVSNYTYVCPYVYDATHGLWLSIVAIGCLARWIATRRNKFLFLAGICTGLVFLTKPELFFALGATVVAGGIVAGRQRIGFANCLLFLSGTLLPALVFVIYFTCAWDFQDGIKSVVWVWLPVFKSSVSQSTFFRGYLGLDRPAANVVLMLEYSGGFALATFLIALFSRCVAERRIPGAIASGLPLLWLLFLAATRFEWPECGRAFLVISLSGAAYLFWKWWKQRRSPEADALVFPLLWSVFALFLLAKMGFLPRIWQYGFFLGMPAAVLVVFLLLKSIPDGLQPFRVHPVAFRMVVIIFLTTGLIRLLQVSNRSYQAKDFPVGENGDKIIGWTAKFTPTAFAIQQTAQWIRENLPPTNTLAAVPDGVMINYLTRRTNPTPYTIFTPTELELFGETNIVAAFAQNSPDYILVVHREFGDWDTNLFGKDRGNGYDLMQWINAHYSPVWLLGMEPLQVKNLFGIKLLKRNGL